MSGIPQQCLGYGYLPEASATKSLADVIFCLAKHDPDILNGSTKYTQSIDLLQPLDRSFRRPGHYDA